MLFLISIFTFTTVSLFLYLIFSSFFKTSQVIKSRLSKISREDEKEANEELNRSLFIRVLHPVLDNISKTILKITPKEIVTSFDRKVIMAGNPFNMTVKDWINMQVIIIFLLPLITITIGYYLHASIESMLFFSITEICIGLILPVFLLSKKISYRQKKIVNSMPDVIDLLTVSVEAGLGFDGALAKVIDKMPGPLASEFENVLQEIKVGKPKREALRDMADRVLINDITTFIGSVIQADQFGVSIGNVLRIQSEQMRQKRRQRAQEKAMKAPVKMLIPMVLFIFPTIFSVLMGPIVIKMIKIFAK